jgi:hypothetical protein
VHIGATARPRFEMPISDPVQLFQMIVDRMNRQDWSGAAGLCDPTSLSVFRRNTLAGLAPENKVKPMTVDEYMKMSKGMPREVAEYNVKELNERSSSYSALHEQFPGVASLGALRALEPVEFYAEFLYGRSPQRAIRDEAQRGELSKRAANALLNTPLDDFSYEAVGYVRDGDRIAHVVYRFKTQLADGPQMKEWLANIPEDEREFSTDLLRDHPLTLSCRRQPDGGWLAIAGFEFIGSGVAYFHVEEKPGDDEPFDEPLELSP